MKIQLFAAAAAVACTMAAGSAYAGDGTLEASYLNLSSGGSADAYSVGGAFNSGPAAGAWGFQGDFIATDSSSFPTALWALQGTAFKRSSANAWGVFAGYSEGIATKTWDVGLVGQLYNESSTLTGTVSYGQADVGVGSNADSIIVNALATFYANENLSFGINGTYQNLSSAGSVDASSIGASVEWQLSNAPVSFTASYSSIDLAGTDADVFTIGARYNFGGKSLKARDQSGVIAPAGQRLRL